MLILDTLVETKGWDVSVTKKYSRMESPRDSRGLLLLLLDEVEEQFSAAAAFFLLNGPIVVHVCTIAVKTIPSRRCKFKSVFQYTMHSLRLPMIW